jgi:hypothetical protein
MAEEPKEKTHEQLGVVAVTDEQAKAVKSLATFGTTIVTEGSQLVQYVGRVLGTAPHDAVGLILGDPLHFVRTAIAAKYDEWLTKILGRRKVAEPQPVSPSLAIPLLRAAYDEARPELQQMWAELIAAAMDPARAGRVRLTFVDALKRFDPLDALVLRARYDHNSKLKPSAVEFIAKLLNETDDEVALSAENLILLKCASERGQDLAGFYLTNYGRALIRACSD